MGDDDRGNPDFFDQIEQKPNPTESSPEIRLPPAVTPIAERSRLGARIARGEFAVSVELTAPAPLAPTPRSGQLTGAALLVLTAVRVAAVW